jgi:adenosylcobinamide-phosphate synthase
VKRAGRRHPVRRRRPARPRSLTRLVARRSIAAGAGVLVDRAIGEPPIDPHPLAVFGDAMKATERLVYADDRVAGVVHASIGVAIGTGAGALVGSTTAATYLAVAGRALHQAADEVAEPLATGDLDRARAFLPSLVGRDPSTLDEPAIARAVVESVAENTTDAVVAPVLWALAVGAPGALGYRAVNTLDAMVGHHSPRYERYGWASARLDDVANWVPGRVTALLVMAARPHRAGAVWHTVRRDARHHPSPNAGVAEAAFAAALGLTLGGTNRYGDRVEHRARLGDGRDPEVGDIAAAVRLADDVATILAVALVGTGVAVAAAAGSRRLRDLVRRA